MTDIELYKNALIEINKIEDQHLLIEDYNYYLNKAIQQYVNLVYNRYDINQQSTDDLSAFQESVIIAIDDDQIHKSSFDQYCILNLPENYLHLLNCIVEFETTGKINCQDKTQSFTVGCKRLTADIQPQIIHNAYMRPTYKNPYYYINNITPEENVGKKLEVHYGLKDLVKPVTVYLTYLKNPEVITLTDEMIDESIDNPDIGTQLPYSDYVCYEIINIFVRLLLEQASDPRLQTNLPINQTIMTNQSQK